MAQKENTRAVFARVKDPHAVGIFLRDLDTLKDEFCDQEVLQTGITAGLVDSLLSHLISTDPILLELLENELVVVAVFDVLLSFSKTLCGRKMLIREDECRRVATLLVSENEVIVKGALKLIISLCEFQDVLKDMVDGGVTEVLADMLDKDETGELASIPFGKLTRIKQTYSDKWCYQMVSLLHNSDSTSPSRISILEAFWNVGLNFEMREKLITAGAVNALIPSIKLGVARLLPDVCRLATGVAGMLSGALSGKVAIMKEHHLIDSVVELLTVLESTDAIWKNAKQILESASDNPEGMHQIGVHFIKLGRPEILNAVFGDARAARVTLPFIKEPRAGEPKRDSKMLHESIRCLWLMLKRDTGVVSIWNLLNIVTYLAEIMMVRDETSVLVEDILLTLCKKEVKAAEVLKKLCLKDTFLRDFVDDGKLSFVKDTEVILPREAADFHMGSKE